MRSHDIKLSRYSSDKILLYAKKRARDLSNNQLSNSFKATYTRQIRDGRVPMISYDIKPSRTFRAKSFKKKLTL